MILNAMSLWASISSHSSCVISSGFKASAVTVLVRVSERSAPSVTSFLTSYSRACLLKAERPSFLISTCSLRPSAWRLVSVTLPDSGCADHSNWGLPTVSLARVLTEIFPSFKLKFMSTLPKAWNSVEFKPGQSSATIYWSLRSSITDAIFCLSWSLPNYSHLFFSACLSWSHLF